MRHAIVIERSSTGFGASVPDLPGCVAAAPGEYEVRQFIREAIDRHLEGMRADDEPTALVDYVEIPRAA